MYLCLEAFTFLAKLLTVSTCKFELRIREGEKGLSFSFDISKSIRPRLSMQRGNTVTQSVASRAWPRLPGVAGLCKLAQLGNFRQAINQQNCQAQSAALWSASMSMMLSDCVPVRVCVGCLWWCTVVHVHVPLGRQLSPKMPINL